MTKKIDEKFEFSKERSNSDSDDVRTLMKMAGIDKKMENNKEGEINFDGMFTGVADGEIKVDEDLEKLKSLAGLSEKNVKKSIFSRDQELDRFSLFKEFDTDDEDLGPNVTRGPWGQGGFKDPMVRDPAKAGRDPDSAEIMDKYHELMDPSGDGSVATMELVDWVKDAFDVPEDRAIGLVQQAYDDSGLDFSSELTGKASNEAELGEATGGPFDNKDMAVADARDQIGGGREGYNFKIVQGRDGWYWDERVDEKSPKGWEGTVKAMKKHSEIDNPWALAHHMKNKGHKSHEGVEEDVPIPPGIDADGEDVADFSNPQSGVTNGPSDAEVMQIYHDTLSTGQHDDAMRHTVQELQSEYGMDTAQAVALLERALQAAGEQWVEEQTPKMSNTFTEGSYDRMIIELIVEEMKKGKDVDDISETLGFDSDEVFYVVEFFKNKKLEEAVEEKETVNESDTSNEDLARVLYLTEYKN